MATSVQELSDVVRSGVTDPVIAADAAPQPPGYEKALTLAALGMYNAATKELRAVITRAPAHYGAWHKLAELLRWAGEDKAADDAEATAQRYAGNACKWQPARDTRTPEQLDAAMYELQKTHSGLARGDQIGVLREQLDENPTDPVAAHLLSRLILQRGDNVTSMALLERTVELAPLFLTARAQLVAVLMGGDDYVRALAQTTILLQQAPLEADYYAIHCEALSGVGDFPAALAITEELLREFPRHPRFWFDRGHLLLAVGRLDAAARAFRTCLDIAPAMGEAYWGLSRSLTDADVAAMRAALGDVSLAPSSRMYMYYALGQALERAGDYAASFEAYQQGARLFRGSLLGTGEAHREDLFIERVRAVKRVYTADNLAKRAVPPVVSPPATPIFVVGMPRAGSTLVEQILASHSRVEATSELALIADIVRDLTFSRRAIRRDAYPDCVLDMTPAQLAALGERYLREATAYRKTERSCFVDKRPWNWLDAGLIHLMLPHAKIIDVRRKPMAACFAMFKQILHGADFSYDLHDLGRYYVEYAGLMEHWASVMPGAIHFVQYEHLVNDTESEIRRMLEYCGLPFEEGCLRFWETNRAVHTASTEQVRRPIYRDAVEQWRNFEPWLGQLKEGLSEPARA